MILPLSGSQKVLWNLVACLGDIDRTIEETNIVEFQRDLEALYPRLQKYGLILTINDPALFQRPWCRVSNNRFERPSSSCTGGHFRCEGLE